MNGRDVLLVSAVRTPIATTKPETGNYRNIHPNALLGACFAEVISRSTVDAANVEDVVTGCVQQVGEQSWNIARNAWLQAGLPITTPATTVDRQCGSGQQAVNFAAALVAAGVHDVVIGAGVEHLSHIPMFSAKEATGLGTPHPPELRERFGLVDQGLSGEMIAEKWGLSRDYLDEIGVLSHQRAATATAEGRFEREILPIEVDGALVTADQSIRYDASIESAARLKPAFKPDGVHTAANSSQLADGASAVMFASPEGAERFGLCARARVIDQMTVGCDPILMLEGPIPATRAILKRNGMAMDDIDLIEINEAFAAVIAAWEHELRPDMDRVNVNGGAIALGHPLGATGARLLTTLVHEMERDDKEIGLVTICCGGGIGTATLVQLV